MSLNNNGGARPSRVLMRAVELLEDGEWHDRESVLRELMKLVPPGQAKRKSEAIRQRNSASPQRVKPMSVERQIESGQRTIARDVLNKRQVFALRYDPPGTARVRLDSMPRNVARERALERSGFDPEHVAHELLRDDERSAQHVFDSLTRRELELVARALIELARSWAGDE